MSVLKKGQSRLTNVRLDLVDNPPSVVNTTNRSLRVMPGLIVPMRFSTPAVQATCGPD